MCISSCMTIAANTPILTSNGWLPAKLIQAGDYVFGQNGMPKEVISVQLFEKGPTYEVAFDDGLTLCGSENMTLHIQTAGTRSILTKGQNASEKLIQVSKIIETGVKRYRAKDGYEYSVPTAMPIRLPERNLPVPPFIAGLWFGKRPNCFNVAVPSEYYNETLRRLRKYGYVGKKVLKVGNNIQIELRPNVQHSFLTKYSEKQDSLPDEYMLGSVDQRIQLLQGLFYNKFRSYNPKRGMYRYSSSNFKLIKTIQYVVESLGVRSILAERPSGARFRLYFRTDLPIMDFEVKKHGLSRFKKRFIRKITEIEPSERVYIEANGPILVGEGFIPAC